MSRDDVKRAFEFEEVSPVPYWVPMEPETIRQVDAYLGSSDWQAQLTPYLAAAHVGFGGEEVDKTTQRDAFGVVFEKDNMMYILVHPLSAPTLEGYAWPDLPSLMDWAGLKTLFDQFPDSYRLCGLGLGLFERSWFLRGMPELLMDMVVAPAFVDELLDRVLEIHLDFMRLCAERLPIEGYFGGDDWCDQRGLIMGPDLWHRFIRPRFAVLVDESHRLGLPYFLHICGNVLPVVDDLMALGLDGIESLQPEATDVYELKRRTQGRMRLIGGMGVQSTLPFGSPEDVRRETRKLQEELGRGGGYVLSPAKPIMPHVPVENVVAFLETLMGTTLHPDTAP